MVNVETFSREAWDLIGRKVAKRAWITETYAMAAESIGCRLHWITRAIAIFRLQLSRQVQLNTERKQLDEVAQRLLAENTDFRRLLTLPGIGFPLASGTLPVSGHLLFRHRCARPRYPSRHPAIKKGKCTRIDVTFFREPNREWSFVDREDICNPGDTANAEITAEVIIDLGSRTRFTDFLKVIEYEPEEFRNRP